MIWGPRRGRSVIEAEFCTDSDGISATMSLKYIKLIVVAHETDNLVNARLFESSDPSLERGIAEAQQIPERNRVFVANDAELRQALLTAKEEGDCAVAVFHNGRHGIMFENPMSLTEFHSFCEKHGVDAVAICTNTWSPTLRRSGKLADFRFDTVVRVLRNASVVAASTKQEWLKRLQEQYSQMYESNLQSRRRLMIGAGIVCAGIASGLVAWVFGSDDNKKRKRTNR